MQSWFGNGIYELLTELGNGILDFLFNFINGIFESAEEMLEFSEIKYACVITSDVATILVSIAVLYNVINIYIFETSGDAEQDPIQQLVNASIAIALIQGYNFLFNWALDLAKQFTSELVSVSLSFDTPENFLEKFSTVIINASNQQAFLIIFIIFIIGMSVFILKAFIRGGELALMKILFPIFCCDLLTASKERFNAFITAFCVTTFSYALQLLCFRLSFNQFMSTNNYLHIAFAFVWLYFAIKAPKWLEKYAYSSGLGGIARTGATSAGQVLTMSLARKVI